MIVKPDNAATVAAPPPPDAREVHDWLEHGHDLATRTFIATPREASGFTVTVAGVQRENGTCRRWVTVEAKAALGFPLEPEAVRQLAAALVAAADEVDARR